MTNGWDESAQAWIKDMGVAGDNGRQHILDPHMINRIENREFATALDVGCGEGRFCRIMQSMGIKTTGIDPTEALLERARQLDDNGQYIEAFAENLPFEDCQFDLVVSCMSLIDIPDYKGAIKEMVRVLKPNGTLLIANLTAMNTAGGRLGWFLDEDKNAKYYAIDNYLTESENWEEWRGIRIKNHHRPLSAYMQCFLENNLILKFFDEPKPLGGNENWQKHYARMPWFLIMEWQKP